MGRNFLCGFAACLVAAAAGAQPDSRTVIESGNAFLSAGAEAIRGGRYDEGIRLTTLGLERYQTRSMDRAAAFANLCAAYAAKGEPDIAIDYCTDSLEINEQNWRAYSNRSYAYYLKGMYSEAAHDLEAAASINPRAREVAEIQGMINEERLRPRIIMEDHQ